MRVGLNIVGGQCYNFSLAPHIIGVLQRILDWTDLQGTGQGPVREKILNVGCFFALESITSTGLGRTCCRAGLRRGAWVSWWVTG